MTEEPAASAAVDPAQVRFDAAGPESSVPVADPEERAGDVRARLVGQRFASAAHVVVCAERRLVGMARIEDVLAAPGTATMSELMDRDPPVVSATATEEEAAWKAVRHGESALAVVGDDGGFLGLVPPRRMVEVLLSGHDQDLARLGGYMTGAARARHATEEPVMPRLWHRLPWLLIGLAGAIASAMIVGSYEEAISEEVLLAFFVPGIVYMADAVGTQTEALVIRGLSVGVPVGRILLRELLTGLLMGLALAAVFVPIGLLVWGDADIVAIVALSLVASCSVATLVAMVLPGLLDRIGLDPAFGSGPLATVVQDLLSLVIYFWIATLVLG